MNNYSYSCWRIDPRASLGYATEQPSCPNKTPAAFKGIAAFYAIVNFPPRDLPTVAREMFRVLEPGGLLLLSFHIGDSIVHLDNLSPEPHGVVMMIQQRYPRLHGRKNSR
jgi:hypothetical protein